MSKFNVIYNDKTIEIDCEDTDNIIDIKKKIISEYNLNCEYIDLFILIERPIRGLGKFNLEKGKLPRTFDNYTLDRWNISDKTIEITFEEVEGYNPTIRKPFIKKANNSELVNKYRPPSIKSGEDYIIGDTQPEYSLASTEDFPEL